jgi:zinc transporter ZupT
MAIHIKSGLGLGISCIVAIVLLYLTGITTLLTMRLYVVFALYIYWMRNAIKEQIRLAIVDLTSRQKFWTAWLTFILGVTISMSFMHVLATYIDPSILEIDKEIRTVAHEQMKAMFDFSSERAKAAIEQAESTDPFSLKSLASLLPSYFILPGALLALIMSRVIRK